MRGNAAQRGKPGLGRLHRVALQSVGIDTIDRVASCEGIAIEPINVACGVCTDPAHQPRCVVAQTKGVKAAGIALFARETHGLIRRLYCRVSRPPGRPAIRVVVLLTEQALILIQFQRVVTLVIGQAITHLPVLHASGSTLFPLQDAHVDEHVIDDQHIQPFAARRIASDLQPRQIADLTQVHGVMCPGAASLVHALTVTVIAVDLIIVISVNAHDVGYAQKLIACIPVQGLPPLKGQLIAFVIKPPAPAGPLDHTCDLGHAMITGVRQVQVPGVTAALSGGMAQADEITGCVVAVMLMVAPAPLGTALGKILLRRERRSPCMPRMLAAGRFDQLIERVVRIVG